MNRYILLFVAASLISSSAFGWGLKGHSTVAHIAENHLTPKAKALIKEYLGGRPMAYYGSHTDFYRSEMLLDVGFEPKQGSRTVEFPHGFRVDKESFKPWRTIENEDGTIFKNSIYHMERLAKNLKDNHAKMNDSVRLVHLYILIHGIGDMHCPAHVEYYGMTPYCKIPICFREGNKWKRRSLHGYWEARMIGAFCPWSYTDLAQIFDTYSDKQIEEFTRGDIYTWAEDIARCAYSVHLYQPEEKIENSEFHRKYQGLAEELITKAGYRLAKLFNEILN